MLRLRVIRPLIKDYSGTYADLGVFNSDNLVAGTTYDEATNISSNFYATKQGISLDLDTCIRAFDYAGIKEDMFNRSLVCGRDTMSVTFDKLLIDYPEIHTDQSVYLCVQYNDATVYGGENIYYTLKLYIPWCSG